VRVLVVLVRALVRGSHWRRSRTSCAAIAGATTRTTTGIGA